MTNPSAHNVLYDPLFDGFAAIAQQRGVTEHGQRDRSLLSQEGPEGDFARAVHVIMTARSQEITPDDLALLRTIHDILRNS